MCFVAVIVAKAVAVVVAVVVVVVVPVVVAWKCALHHRRARFLIMSTATSASDVINVF